MTPLGNSNPIKGNRIDDDNENRGGDLVLGLGVHSHNYQEVRIKHKRIIMLTINAINSAPMAGEDASVLLGAGGVQFVQRAWRLWRVGGWGG